MKPTTEQILSALNKLIRENKTELKTEKVELGAIDDFEKLFNKSIDASVKIGTTFIDAVSKAQSKYKGNISDMEKALKIGTEIKKQAKELGVDLPKAELIKLIVLKQILKKKKVLCLNCKNFTTYFKNQTNK